MVVLPSPQSAIHVGNNDTEGSSLDRSEGSANPNGEKDARAGNFPQATGEAIMSVSCVELSCMQLQLLQSKADDLIQANKELTGERQ